MSQADPLSRVTPVIVAIAELAGLVLDMPDDQRAGVNDMLAACQLADWTLG